MSFRNFYYEQANQEPWYAKVPMSSSVGPFLIGAINLANAKQGGLQESQWDNSSGRGFPLSQPALDFMSAAPRNQGTMTQAFAWLVSEGLYEATKIRQGLARQASKDLQMPVSEDMLYSPKAHKQFPALHQWVKSVIQEDPHAFEPKNPIEINTDKGVISFTPQEVNSFLHAMNQKVGAPLFKEFSFGPRFDQEGNAADHGFIEWVEDGPWADKGFGTERPNEPWRTRHGISLHNPKRHDQHAELDQGQVAYSFGDGNVVTPMRDELGVQKFLSTFPLRILGNTFRTLSGDLNKLPPEQQQQAKMILDKAKNGAVKDTINYKAMRGVDMDNKTDEFQDLDSYLAHAFLARLGLKVRTKVSDYIQKQIAGGKSEDEAKAMAQKVLQDIGFSDLASAPDMWSSVPEKRLFYHNNLPHKNDRKGGPRSVLGDYQATDDEIKRSIALGLQAAKSGTQIPSVGQLGGKKDRPMLATLYSTGHQFLRDLKSKPGGIEKEFSELMGGLIPNELRNSVMDQINNISEVEPSINTHGVVPPANTNLGTTYAQRTEIPPKQFRTLTGDEPFSVQPEQDKEGRPIPNSYVVYNNTTMPPTPTNVRGSTPDRLLTPEQKLANSKAGWRFVKADNSPEGGGAGEDQATRGFLVKNNERIKITRQPGGNWTVLDKSLGTPNPAKAAVPTLLPSDHVRYAGGKGIKRELGQGDVNAKELEANTFHKNPNSFGYNSPSDYEEEIRNLANEIKNRSFSHDSRESIGLETALAYVREGMLKYMADSSEFGRRFGNLDDKDYLSKMQKIAAEHNIDFPKAYAELMMARKTGDTSRIDPNAIAFFTNMGREYRKSQALKNANKIISSQAVRGGIGGAGDDGEYQSHDFADDEGKGHVGINAGSKRGRSNVVGSFDMEKDTGIQQRTDLSTLGVVSTAKAARDKSISSIHPYQQTYQDVFSKLNGKEEAITPATNKAVAILSQGGGVSITNYAATAMLDAAIDSALTSLRANIGNVQKSPLSIGRMQSIIRNSLLPLKGLPNMVSFNIDNAIRAILGQHYDQIMNGLTPAAPPAATPSVAPMAHMPADRIAARQPAPTPNPEQKPMLNKPSGLGSFMKKKNETYSFKERAEKRLREMVGTSAVYDGTKGTFNWWGAVGLPGGKCIDGEVETRNSDPDGAKGKKSARAKKR